MRRLLALALIALPSFAYITQTVTTGGQSYTIRRYDNASISYLLNNQLKAGVQVGGKTMVSPGSNTAAASQAALDTWNAAGANIHFNTLGTTSLVHDMNDCKPVILMATSANDIAALGGALAITATAYTLSAGSVCGNTTSSPPGTIVDSDVIFGSGPAFTFSTDNVTDTIDFQSVLTHELGHALGSNHSALIGSTMFWASTSNQLNQRYLTTDDVAFVTTVYPGANANPGTLNGKISTSGGGAVKFGLITAIDRTAGTTFGGITGADGNYSINLPPGSYIVYAEPFNPFVSPGNIYSETGVLGASQVTTGFLPTFLGTLGSPTITAVTAGQTSTANITVTSGTSSLTGPFFGTGTAGGSGGIGTFAGLQAAITLSSGKSIDLAMGGGGIDTSTSFLVFGRGISIKPGSMRQDGNLSVGPIMRFTLDIPAQTDNTLASLWIVKGNNILAFSGGLFITAPKPVVTGVFDAESARPSFTSGQWVAIYGTNLAGTTRTWAASDFTGGVSTGSPLPSTLDGVSVTINGVAASIYLVSPAQLNILTPSNLTPGPATVVVTNNGVVSSTFQATVVSASPSFFYYGAGGKVYAAAVHLNGNLVGDPAVTPGSEKAHPGELILMYVNGIAAATGGVIVPVTPFSQQVSISAGSNALSTSAPFLVSAGQFQVNATIPGGLAAGEYTLSMSVPGGSTSDSGLTVILPVGQ